MEPTQHSPWQIRSLTEGGRGGPSSAALDGSGLTSPGKCRE